MMRSMFSGVSGLKIHQTKMDVIGNNIANVNTTGFKSGRVTFNEVFSQTLQGASGSSESIGGRNPMQIGLGANISSIDTLMTEGAAQRTDNPLDLKIEGDGFFVVGSGAGYNFTRAGAFRIDEAGNLVNPDGLTVMGWQVNRTTNEIEKSKVQRLQIMSPDNLFAEPTATSEVTMSGNIDKNDQQLLTANGGLPFSFNFYDSLGFRYTAEFTITKDPADPATAFNISIPANAIKDENGNTITNNAVAATITFDAATGKIDTVAGISGFSITGVATPFSVFADPINVDVTSLTMFAGKSTLQGRTGDLSGNGGGNEAGSLSGFDIGSDGKVVGRYTNGETKTLGQIAIAKFQNPAGLQKDGNNLFSTTQNSGDFDGIGVDITADGGALNAGVLEMSNVDLSREFTEMITTQRGFQANSRVITASDELLQELVNLKR